jgi:hypothetical protein
MQVDRDLVEAARHGDREAYADLIRARGDRRRLVSGCNFQR